MKNVLLAAAIVVGTTAVVWYIVHNYWFEESANSDFVGMMMNPDNKSWPAPIPGSKSYQPKAAAPTFPAITEIPVVSASEAADKLGATDLVLGVTVNGESRAYPIDFLTGPEREIFNDRLGGRSIAATW